jgi:predicted Rossmann fold flavoprotein
MLADECRQAGARIEVNSAVTSVQLEGEGFTLETGGGSTHAGSLVIASGGLSIPKMGATNFGYELAKRFGHAIVPTRPALVPLTFSADDLARYKDLSGIGLPVEASCNGQSFGAPMLFTHRGLSGPAILQISSYWRHGQELRINLLPGMDAAEWLLERQQSRAGAELKSVLGERFPKRLAQTLSEIRFASRPLRHYRLAELRHVAAQLQSWAFHPVGTEGYRTAEVTAGGVNTDELSSTTMESKKTPGLYIIGEVVDVTGHLGGFNFQWAWASGHAAGEVV